MEPFIKKTSDSRNRTSQSKGEDNDVVTFDSVLEELGPVGKFQVTQIGLMLGLSFFHAFISLSFVFLGFTPQHECNRVNETELLSYYGLDIVNSSTHVAYKSCEMEIFTNQTGGLEILDSVACPSGRNFSQYSTYSAYWDLVCESKGQVEMSYTLFSAGRIPGGLIGGILPDKYGRKTVTVIGSLIACIFETVSILSPNIYVFDVLKFASGFFFQSASSCSFVLMSELVVSRHRQVFAAILNVVWVCSCLLVAAFAYILQFYKWQYFQAIITYAFVPLLLITVFGKESIRWLAANNRTEEALSILQLACKQNKKDYKKVKERYLAYVDNMFQDTTNSYDLQPLAAGNNEDAQNAGFDITISEREYIRPDSTLSLLKHKKILALIAMNVHIWLTHTLTYFGLYLTSTSLIGNRFLNFSLMALVEIPASFIIPILDVKMGRRALLASCLCVTAVTLLASTLLLTFGYGLESFVFSILGKCSISTSFGFIYIFTSEMFPTNIRSTVLGHCSSVSRLGSVFAPYLRPLIDLAIWAPGVIFSIMCAIALLLTLVMPETKNEDMPNTLEEFLKTSNKNKKAEKMSESHDGKVI